MRTVARAPRLRRNGSRLAEGPGRSVDVIGETDASMGGALEGGAVTIDGGLDERIAGKPSIVFFRGGLEEYAVLTSDFVSASGGGVTTGGGEAEPTPGGMKP